MNAASLLAGMMLAFYGLVIILFLVLGFRLLFGKRRLVRAIGFTIILSPVLTSALIQMVSNKHSLSFHESKLNYSNAVATMDVSLCKKTSDPEGCREKVEMRLAESGPYNNPPDTDNQKSSEPALPHECTDEPEQIAIGRSVYPKQEEYAQLKFLGELFTASECGEERMAQLFGVSNGNYTLKPKIWLKTNPSDALLKILKATNFICSQKEVEESSCTEWALWDIVPISEILKLKPFAEEIKIDDCRNCG